MELHFLEIPKYTHKPISEMTKMERWLTYFANQLNKQEREELAMSEATYRDRVLGSLNAIYNNTNQLAALQQELAKATEAANVWHGRYVEATQNFDSLLKSYQELAQDKHAEVEQKYITFSQEADKICNKNR